MLGSKEVATLPVLEDAQHLAPDLVQLRHALHGEPEVGLDLPRTQQKVLAALEGLPLEITTGNKTTSVTAVLRGAAPDVGPPGAPAVLLRADMDALPVQEATGLAFASKVDGAMHACGHDLHTAMLVGAARLLSAHRDQLTGDVVLMFQPGEEGWDGASVMIEEGVLDAAGRRVDAAYGMHVFSAFAPHGRFLTRPGTMLAASAELYVTVHGAGGHGSTPHLAQDPVTVISEMVLALQTMVTRQFDVFDPLVVTVGLLQAGTKANVIPGTASFEATVRSFSPEAREAVRVAAPRLLRGIAAAHGVEVAVDFVDQYPPTVNDVDETAFAEQTVVAMFGHGRHAPLAAPFVGSEDFSRVLDLVPGSFIALGAVPAGMDAATAPFNHSPHARFDDAVLPDGAALYAELALRRLASQRSTPLTHRSSA